MEKRPIYFTRQLDGALNRVPNDFYDRVWHILERTPPGLKVAGYYLPQVIPYFYWIFHIG
jgi:phosphorylase kinase alpha/beta subunit